MKPEFPVVNLKPFAAAVTAIFISARRANGATVVVNSCGNSGTVTRGKAFSQQVWILRRNVRGVVQLLYCAYRKPRLAHYGSRRAHVTCYTASLHLVDFKCAASFGEVLDRTYRLPALSLPVPH